MTTSSPLAHRSRRLRAVLLAGLAAAGLLGATGLVGPVSAAPFVDCNRPVYNKSISAKVRCDALTTAKVRLKVTCWIGPVPSATKYTSWVTIPGGSYRTLTFTSGGWCTSPAQTWVVSPQIAGS